MRLVCVEFARQKESGRLIGRRAVAVSCKVSCRASVEEDGEGSGILTIEGNLFAWARDCPVSSISYHTWDRLRDAPANENSTLAPGSTASLAPPATNSATVTLRQAVRGE